MPYFADWAPRLFLSVPVTSVVSTYSSVVVVIAAVVDNSSSHRCMLAQQSLPRVAALSHVMRLVARQCSAQRQPLSRRDCLRGLSTHTAAATTQAARRPVLTIWATARAQCGVQCRSSSSDNGPISSSRSLDEGAADGDSGSGALKLSESEPGVERQEDDFRPAEARPSIAAAAAAASRDDTEAGAAEQPSEATGPLRPLSTYREVLADSSTLDRRL